VAADAASHLALSNRAIVRYKLGEWENAARDAEAAIALRAPGFGKPFSTRGAALERLGRLDEALASYEEGLRVEPGSATLSANKAKLEDSLRRRFAPNASGGGGGGGGGGARPGAEVPRFFESRPTVADDDWDAPAHAGLARWARLALLLARVALLALWLAYLLPLGREAPFLASRLAAREGWEPLVKRGLHTLRKPQYEAVVVPRGPRWRVVAPGSDAYEALKTLTQARVFAGAPLGAPSLAPSAQ
jgi:tetratricopeptide (TPR) repeat protein